MSKRVNVLLLGGVLLLAGCNRTPPSPVPSARAEGGGTTTATVPARTGSGPVAGRTPAAPTPGTTAPQQARVTTDAEPPPKKDEPEPKTDNPAPPSSPSAPGDVHITKVTLLPAKDGTYKLTLSLKDPLPKTELDRSIRLLFLSPKAKKEYRSAADIQFGGGRISTGWMAAGKDGGFAYSLMEGPVTEGDDVTGYLVDLSSDLSKWPKASPPAIELDLVRGQRVWSDGLAGWIAHEKRGSFHVAVTKYAKDGNTQVLAGNNSKGEFDFSTK
jgi:hypothetical protein